MMLPASIGLALGLAGFGLAHLVGLARERGFFVTCLVVIALLYILFAVQGGEAAAILLHSVIAAAFLSVAVFGYVRSLWAVVAGLAAHGVFDLVLPLVGDSPAPHWWGPFCAVFDLVFAAALAWLIVSKAVAARV